MGLMNFALFRIRCPRFHPQWCFSTRPKLAYWTNRANRSTCQPWIVNSSIQCQSCSNSCSRVPSISWFLNSCLRSKCTQIWISLRVTVCSRICSLLLRLWTLIMSLRFRKALSHSFLVRTWTSTNLLFKIVTLKRHSISKPNRSQAKRTWPPRPHHHFL